MLLKGGTADGWSFSSAESANDAGYRRNRSPVSTNSFTARCFAPEDAQVAEQGKDYILRASSGEPLALDYEGSHSVKELWLEGVLMPPSRYSPQNVPTIFEGPGTIGFSRATLLKLR